MAGKMTDDEQMHRFEASDGLELAYRVDDFSEPWRKRRGKPADQA